MSPMIERKSPAVEKFDRDGYVISRNVIDADLIGEVRAHVEWLMKKHPDRRPESLGRELVHGDPFWVRLVGDDRLLDIAEQFIGPNIALFASHYISKPPLDGQPVLWHQDGSYWPLEPMEVVTLWLAVDDSTPENGCMRVVPGTQTWQLHKMKPVSDMANVLKSEIDVDPSLIDETKAVNIELKAGDVSVHHPNIVHGSKPNLSPRRRCGLTIRYIPTTTRITRTPWDCAYLLRGHSVAGINDYVPHPKFVEGQHMPFRGCERTAR